MFIGDEVTAAGFRLAGATAITPAEDQVEEVFEGALADAEFIMIAASVANRLPAARLERALRKRSPLVSVVPDATGELPEDQTALVRRALGLAS